MWWDQPHPSHTGHSELPGFWADVHACVSCHWCGGPCMSWTPGLFSLCCDLAMTHQSGLRYSVKGDTYIIMEFSRIMMYVYKWGHIKLALHLLQGGSPSSTIYNYLSWFQFVTYFITHLTSLGNNLTVLSRQKFLRFQSTANMPHKNGNINIDSKDRNHYYHWEMSLHSQDKHWGLHSQSQIASKSKL